MGTKIPLPRLTYSIAKNAYGYITLWYDRGEGGRQKGEQGAHGYYASRCEAAAFSVTVC